MSRPVLLIAGGSRGIGASTAKLAGARGYDVAVNYKNNSNAAAGVVAAVKAAGGSAVAVQGDMAIEADIILSGFRRHGDRNAGPYRKSDAIRYGHVGGQEVWAVRGRPHRILNDHAARARFGLRESCRPSQDDYDRHKTETDRQKGFLG